MKPEQEKIMNAYLAGLSQSQCAAVMNRHPDDGHTCKAIAGHIIKDYEEWKARLA